MNCILSNPYDRNKVVKTGLFNNRMAKIDKDIRLNFFVELFLKTFPMSNVCLYGHPVVIKCEITIDKDDKMMMDAVLDFKKIFMVDDEQLEINDLAINDRRNVNTLSQWTSDMLPVQVMYKYEQMFPCSFILNMFNDDNASLNGKKVIVVPSVKAKEATRNILEEIMKSLDPSSERVDHHTIMNNYIDCIVDTLDEQCAYLYLPKQIKFKIVEKNKVWNPTNRNIVMHLFLSLTETTVVCSETNSVITDTGTSTRSGIIRANNNYFLFTTGHKLNKDCEVVNENYSMKDFM